jgi:hypothetical protein
VQLSSFALRKIDGESRPFLAVTAAHNSARPDVETRCCQVKPVYFVNGKMSKKGLVGFRVRFARVGAVRLAQ